jgi:REP element-mobilizing transposase RayT
MARGIERRDIFADDTDRTDFLQRIGAVLKWSGATVYAWCLIPNHVHLLVRSGRLGLSAVMQGVLGGYASRFNRRHRRSGHLFQNRFKSIVVEEEAYLLELVRYIHLNPARAGLVDAGSALDSYAWSGMIRAGMGRGSHHPALDSQTGTLSTSRFTLHTSVSASHPKYIESSRSASPIVMRSLAPAVGVIAMVRPPLGCCGLPSPTGC